MSNKRLSGQVLSKFWISIGLWLFSFALGLWVAQAANPISDTNFSSDRVTDFILKNSTTLNILKINLAVTLLAACGIFTFGLTTLAVLLPSGVVTGLVTGVAVRNGIPITAILAVTLPHCVELVGLWIASAIGLRGIDLGNRFFASRLVDIDIQDFWLLARMFLLSLVLTILAAIIEGELTIKHIAKWYV